MSEFVFRNLSMKVFPVEVADQGCPDESVTVVACSPCTDLCTGTYRACSPADCTHMESIPIAKKAVCRGPATTPGYVDTRTNIILPAGDAATELAVLKEGLRVAMSAVETAEQKLQSGEELSAVEGIDRLRSELLGAVAELDEYRGQLE